MSKLLDQIQKLIALTGSPYEEEARSAAYRACKLIRDNGIKLTLEEPVLLPVPAQKPVQKPVHNSSQRQYTQHRPTNHYPPKVGRATRVMVDFEGHCLACRGPFNCYDTVYWVRGLGFTHDDCVAYWTA